MHGQQGPDGLEAWGGDVGHDQQGMIYMVPGALPHGAHLGTPEELVRESLLNIEINKTTERYFHEFALSEAFWYCKTGLWSKHCRRPSCAAEAVRGRRYQNGTRKGIKSNYEDNKEKCHFQEYLPEKMDN
jgi:hypothetical protein